ncbi:MAG: sigma-70 family RNA polymerase sigma factor [Planctomycetia bacterium]|nr:sigma-70 family RNA polymerase sigma factor [Planctomycetia bacterium]
MQQSLSPSVVPNSEPNAVQESVRSDAELLTQFSAARDEGAFSELVRRHGPLVLGVCRRILGDVHAADDVFQAVFLVLARKAGSIKKPELLANWLYGVACRIARKARTRTIRNVNRERCAVSMPMTEERLELEWAELKQALDEEVSRLPEKYRAPLVLCYFQGQTNAQAAAQLGWPLGSMSERLAQAREMLRTRLNRRGMRLTTALLAILLTQKAASAAVSTTLVATTVKTAVTGSVKSATTASVSHSVLELARESAGLPFASAGKVLVLTIVIMASAVSICRSQGISIDLSSMIPGWAGGQASHSGGGSACSIGGPPGSPPVEMAADRPADSAGE